MSTYFKLLLFSVIVPLVFTFHRKIAFYRAWKYLLPAILITSILFISWDILYTRLGVWGFNPRHLQGIYLFGLPMEEYLFFLVIPYCSLFTYYSLNKWSPAPWFEKNARVISLALIGFSLVLGLAFFTRLYTSFNFLLTALLLLLFQIILKSDMMGKFYRAYLVILLPFFLVNGVLTGTGIAGEVVWYNNTENMGMRILTIPPEDIFYGFNLILINTWIFEYLRKKY